MSFGRKCDKAEDVIAYLTEDEEQLGKIQAIEINARTADKWTFPPISRKRRRGNTHMAPARPRKLYPIPHGRLRQHLRQGRPDRHENNRGGHGGDERNGIPNCLGRNFLSPENMNGNRFAVHGFWTSTLGLLYVASR